MSCFINNSVFSNEKEKFKNKIFFHKMINIKKFNKYKIVVDKIIILCYNIFEIKGESDKVFNKSNYKGEKMIKDYYYFKKPLRTKGIEFYKKNRIKFCENIKTYKDFAQMIAEKFLENNDEFFLEAIEYKAEAEWKSQNEVLRELNEKFRFVDFEIDEDDKWQEKISWNKILKKCLASILKTGFSEIGINENEEITDAKLIELLRKLKESKYIREFEMLEDWINEDLSEIADSVFESLLETKKDNPELDITDSEVIENERYDYANELDYPKKELEKLDKLIKYKVENEI